MFNFKIADQDWEFQQIHKLNYETFVEEIPQHRKNARGILIDKFHNENAYIICVKENCLAGMIAIRDKRPFSLDNKLKNLDDYLPKSKSVCELRLLSIKREYRKRKVIRGLFKYLADYCESMDYNLALISATTNESRLYRSLGFEPFGPLVGNNGAKFQPMYLTYQSYGEFKKKTKLLKSVENNSVLKRYSFQPGPVEIGNEVREEFVKPPVSHRSQQFEKKFGNTKKKLSQLVNCRFTQILMGSGTLANDAVAVNLSTLFQNGLILSNGEFGDRLVNHAERFNLSFETYSAGWGNKLNHEKIVELLRRRSFNWLWFVHCETSTGVLNSLEDIKNICIKHSVRLCVDCVSSVGTVPVNLNGIYMATAASGKGLASYPGLSFVFHNQPIVPSNKKSPRYLDLESYSSINGVPYTMSSNLLYAISKSLDLIDVEFNVKKSQECSVLIRDRLKEMGLDVMGSEDICSHAILTFKLPENLNSLELGEELAKLNIHVGYRSKYLAERNLMQFALMGKYSKTGLEFALSWLEKLILS